MRHMVEQARVGKAAGIKSAVVQKNGDLVRLAPGKPGKFGEVRAGRLILDGDIIAPADGESMVMRRRLAGQGVIFAVVTGPGKVMVEGVGLPLDEDYDDFAREAEADAVTALAKLKGARGRDREAVIEAVRLAVRRAAQRWSGKKPQVRVMLVSDSA
jgi:ribonuclease J